MFGVRGVNIRINARNHLKVPMYMIKLCCGLKPNWKTSALQHTLHPPQQLPILAAFSPVTTRAVAVEPHVTTAQTIWTLLSSSLNLYRPKP